MADPVISDAQLHEWRDSGQLVCQCAHPQPQPIGWGGAYQCRHCFKALLSHPPSKDQP